MTRCHRAAAALAAVLLLAAGCRRAPTREIAVVPKATSHLFWQSVQAGAVAAGRDFRVNILWNGAASETDYSRQIEIVDSMIARHVNALAISATDDRALVDPVERVIRAGIPVTIFDSAVNIDNFVSLIATDNHAAGCTAARQLAALLPGKSAIAMMMQKPGGVSTELRERGFEETIRQEFPRLEIVARQYGMGDRARSMGIAENILAAHPGLGGIFASSEACSIGAIRAIRARGLSGRVKLITFDVSAIHVEALRDGTADVMLVQDAFRIGYQAVKSLAMKLAGESPSRRLDIPARVVTKANLNLPDVQALLKPALAAK